VFHDISDDILDDDSCPIDSSFECPSDIDRVVYGRFNGGRHEYVEVEGMDQAVAEFEEAFLLISYIYDLSTPDVIAGCAAGDLDYLRKRKIEFDEERERSEIDAEQQKERERWRASEWCNLEKLAQAARDAGWLEFEPDHYFGKKHKRCGFYYDVGTVGGRTLRLSIYMDDSHEYAPVLRLDSSCEIIHTSGCICSFGDWNQSSTRYVSDMGFIDRWLGIPTPERAVQALKLILTCDNHSGRHMQSYCAEFKL